MQWISIYFLAEHSLKIEFLPSDMEEIFFKLEFLSWSKEGFPFRTTHGLVFFGVEHKKIGGIIVVILARYLYILL